MKFARMWFCCALLAVPAAAQDVAPPPQQRPVQAEQIPVTPQIQAATERANCTIQGMVIAEPGGRPIKKVSINVISYDEEEGPTYTTVTDVEGRFKIEQVKPGRYYFWMERNGFLDAGKRRGGSRAHTLFLSPGEEIKDLLFRMQPAAVISGKILDEDGDPAAYEGVQVIRRGTSSRRNGFGGFDRSNDLGKYRVGNLPPGKYLIMAVPMRHWSDRTTTNSGGTSRSTTRYPTYYSGTADKNQAVPVELHAGDEVPVNLTLISGPAFRVRGRIANRPDGWPEMSVSLHPQGGEPWATQEFDSEVKKDGAFEFSNVLPGTYEADLVTMIAPNAEGILAGQVIEVKDADVDGVILTPAPFAEVRGQVRTEEVTKIDWSRVSVKLDSSQEPEPNFYWGNVGITTAQVKNDGSFDLKKVPRGDYHIEVNSDALALRDYFVKAVNLGGKDVADLGFTLSNGTSSLEIVLSSKGATVTGTIVDSKNQPVVDAVVAVPSADRRKRRDLFSQATSDQTGGFIFQGMDPGQYTILAFEGLEDDYHDPDFLKSNEERGQSVSVQEGERKSVLLKVIPSADSAVAAAP